MDPFRLAVHRTHRLAAVEAPRIAQLAGETWIDVPEGAAGGGLLAAVCDAAGIDHRVAFESDDYGAIHEMVGARLGIALLPDLALVVDHADVVLRTLSDVTPTRRIQAATKPAAVRAPAAGAMLAILAGTEPRRRAPQPATASGPSR
jgi:LysR family transcriptional regulator, transcription activator of glutamate synthase operon